MLSAAKTGGKAVKTSTMTKISQTWFASQIGPMAWAIACRCSPARGPLRQQIPDAAAEIGPAQQRVEHDTPAAGSRR